MQETNPYLKPNRNSRMSLGEVYFWTSTIKDWKHLLDQDKYKSGIYLLIILIGFKMEMSNLIVQWVFCVPPMLLK